MIERKYIKHIEKYAGHLLILGITAVSSYIAQALPEAAFAQSPTLQTASAESFERNYLRPPVLMQTIKTDPLKFEGFSRTDIVIQGIAGHYSRAGCLGCSAGMIMSNGEPLKDDDLTLAAPAEIPLNSSVLITNIRNGHSTIAKVTDRGGFRELGRVADLTPALKYAIGGETDLMNVEITVLEPSDPTPDNP